jgi:hypothetical protein
MPRVNFARPDCFADTTPDARVHKTRRLRFCAVCAALLLGLPAPDFADEPAASEKSDETWQVVYLGGARVGYAHATTETRRRDDGKNVIVSDLVMHLKITRFNATLSMTTGQYTEEDEDGNLLGFRFRMDNPPVSSMSTVGTITDGKLKLETTNGGRTTVTTQDWDPTVKSPAWQDRSLLETPLKPGESREFTMFEPQMNKSMTVTITDKGMAKTKLLNGEERELHRVAITQSLIPGVVIDTYLDEANRPLKTDMGLLQMVLYTVDKETALKEIGNEPLDLAVETLVKVPPIERAHEKSQIVYRIEVASGDAAARFAQGATQSTTAGFDKFTDVTVTALKPADARGDETAGPDYLKSTQYLECDDPEVRAHADKAVGKLKDPVEVALAMEKYVHTEMKDKNFATGLATASEVARSMEGDCTEHAVLLAAMLRAKEVPSRVAIGMVYADKLSAFAGHMWTEALLNGAWVPLDATLGRGGIGAAHIKVSDSSLAENAPTPVTAFLPMVHLLGQMKIEVVSAK